MPQSSQCQHCYRTVNQKLNYCKAFILNLLPQHRWKITWEKKNLNMGAFNMEKSLADKQQQLKIV